MESWLQEIYFRERLSLLEKFVFQVDLFDTVWQKLNEILLFLLIQRFPLHPQIPLLRFYDIELLVDSHIYAVLMPLSHRVDPKNFKTHIENVLMRLII